MTKANHPRLVLQDDYKRRIATEVNLSQKASMPCIRLVTLFELHDDKLTDRENLDLLLTDALARADFLDEFEASLAFAKAEIEKALKTVQEYRTQL